MYLNYASYSQSAYGFLFIKTFLFFCDKNLLHVFLLCLLVKYALGQRPLSILQLFKDQNLSDNKY